MLLGDCFRRLGRKPRLLTIELVAGDRMALGRTICRFTRAERAALPWPDAHTARLYERLMARNPRGYDGWHPGGEQRVPVRLSAAQWRMVDHLCTQQLAATPNAWPSRILAAIGASAGATDGAAA
ncbi:hypothetical protein ACFOD9_07275 [Novosphingobium bradum]|uniref:Uncharacterized protein n=1 Tax=Novosphingobium bradum TaxID=1737444 RepID=A0ABV7IMX7_9SPHN